MIHESITILYVEDQARSAAFYAAVLGHGPRLDVPGMTEFELRSGTILGLMPTAGIRRLLAGTVPPSAAPSGLLRAEVYLLVDDPEVYQRRALAAGAARLTDLTLRDWGHWAAYCLDLDGHVLAFASEAPREAQDAAR